MGSHLDERYLREQQFWNSESTEEARARAVTKYYEVTGSRDKFYKDLLVFHSRGRVLEYGCGQGGWARLLAKNGASVVAIDLSERQVEQAREMARGEGLEHVVFQVGNAEALDFDNDAFDLICGTAILHHLDLHKAFSEIARTLRPDGIAAFMEPLAHNPLINFYRRLTPSLRTEDEHPLRVEDIQLARSFFSKVDEHYFSLLSLVATPFRNTRYFKGLLSALDATDRFLFRRVPFLRKYAWYCVMVFSHPK